MKLDVNFGKDVAVIEDYRYIEGEDLTAEPKPENKFTITVDGDFSDNELMFEKIGKVEKGLDEFPPLYFKKGQ